MAAVVSSLLHVMESSVWADEVSVELPAGFEIKKWVGDEVTPDAACMGIDAQGNLVVSGRGYLKRLRVSNETGKVDAVESIANFPGVAQGILFDGDRVWLTANKAILRSKVRRGADQPYEFETVCKVTTDVEHGAHAIRKGPDNWIYVLCGNKTAIRPEYFSLKTSPIKTPRAGFLMRFPADVEPDNFAAEIVCHGFRNPYDFDFDSQGRIYVFDSDGERDVSLPWYRPTRLFQVGAGDDGGWVSTSWKRPAKFFDMPKRIGDFGRGSPTGVEICPDDRFGESFRHAIFVGDWTFGRIGVAKYDSETGQYGPVEVFAKPKNHFGFAVTDLEFATDGSLLVSTGGRRTEGAIYRITRPGQEFSKAPAAALKFDDVTQFSAATVRALRPGVSAKAPSVVALLAQVEARKDRDFDIVVLNYLSQRSLADAQDPKTVELLGRLLARCAVDVANEGNAELLLAGRRFVATVSESLRDRLVSEGNLDATPVALLFPFGDQGKQLGPRYSLICDLVKSEKSAIVRDRLLRILQLHAGGCGGDRMFAGYSPAQSLSVCDDASKAVVAALETIGAGNLSEQAGRLAAMHRVESAEFRRQMIALAGQQEDPVRRIHWLNCIALTGGSLDAENRREVATLLLSVRRELEALESPLDRNWKPRMLQLAGKLFSKPETAQAVVNQNDFGLAADAWIFSALPRPLQGPAAAKIAAQIVKDPESVTAEQLGCVAATPGFEDLTRSFSSDPRFTDLVVRSIGSSATADDRGLLMRGIQSIDARSAKLAAVGLRRARITDPTNEEMEQVFRVIRQKGFADAEVSIKDQLILLLRTWTGKEMGYQLNGYEANESLKNEQRKAVVAWEQYLIKNEIMKRLANESDAIMKRLGSIDFSTGSAKRGQAIFVARQCAKCHQQGGRNAGPRLEGIASRFSRDDVFRAILYPHENVPDRYRATTVVTDDGELFSGTIVYESTDGILLADSAGEVVRIEAGKIEQRELSDKSLMPTGLLDGASDQEVADLWEFLKK